MTPSRPYAGDVSPAQAFEGLSADPAAALVDVRSSAEWTFVGAPDLAALGKRTVFCAWQDYPAMAVDPRFAERAAAMVKAAGGREDAAVYMICRSGARSRAAAIALTAAGFARVYNVAEGFEGDCDDEGHRGRLGGWKASGLPWRQS